MNYKAFCIECGEYTDYIVKKKRVHLTEHGIDFNYMEKHAICSVCGNKVYSSKLNDENVEARLKAFDKAFAEN